MTQTWTDESLAAACAKGDRQALEEFERRYASEIERGVAKLDGDGAARDELAQRIRERLFVGASPKIATWDGRGDLLHWLRVVVVRMRADFARSHGRASRHTTTTATAGDHAVSPADDPEFSHLKTHYGAMLSEAIDAAMAALSDRDRELLRLSTLEAQTSEAIGARFGVSSATARRWIAAAREAVHAGTRREITKRLGVGKRDFASIVRLARSQLDVSIPRLLAADSDERG